MGKLVCKSAIRVVAGSVGSGLVGSRWSVNIRVAVSSGLLIGILLLLRVLLLWLLVGSLLEVSLRSITGSVSICLLLLLLLLLWLLHTAGLLVRRRREDGLRKGRRRRGICPVIWHGQPLVAEVEMQAVVIGVHLGKQGGNAWSKATQSPSQTSNSKRGAGCRCAGLFVARWLRGCLWWQALQALSSPSRQQDVSTTALPVNGWRKVRRCQRADRDQCRCQERLQPGTRWRSAQGRAGQTGGARRGKEELRSPPYKQLCISKPVR